MATTDHSQATLVADDPQVQVGGGSSSRADRATSYDPAIFPVPTGREEDWRFTPIDALEAFFAEDFTGDAVTVEATGAELEQVAMDDPRLGQLAAPGDRVAALTWAKAKTANVVTVSGEEPSEAIVSVRGTGGEDITPLVFHIRAEANASGTVVVNHTGAGRVAEGVEIDVADGAHLTFVTVQDWDDEAQHLSANRLRLGKDATLRHIVVTLGGKIVRVTTDAEYAGTGGDLELLGAYFTDSGQHQEHRLFVDHTPPNCRSNATYKGALQGESAHSVWVGDVLIRPSAEGTDTYELNRNLVLTLGAMADSVPNLEIETGEIEGAGHASATGRFDDEQLFYLRARGIPEDVARRLVVRGFFAELINQIGVESVQNKLMEAIEEELDQTMKVAS